MGKGYKKRRFRDLNDLRRYMADLINRLDADVIDPAKASKLGYLCQIMARIIEVNDLEARIQKLEEEIR